MGVQLAEAGLLQQAQEAVKAREYERALELYNQVPPRAARRHATPEAFHGFVCVTQTAELSACAWTAAEVDALRASVVVTLGRCATWIPAAGAAGGGGQPNCGSVGRPCPGQQQAEESLRSRSGCELRN